MTTPDPDPPLWVSVEGINGVGKTSALRSAAAMLGTRALLLDELTDQGGAPLPRLVIDTLGAGGDPFLRTGHPVAETLALLALQIGKIERLTPRTHAGAEVILEDRGIDSVAVYQAAILCTQHRDTAPESVVQHILSSVGPWRAFPDATILLTGDPAVCAARFADRIGRRLAPHDVSMIEHIDRLYRTAAAADPGRYTVLDVSDMSAHDTGVALFDTVTVLLDRQAAHAS